MSLAVRLFNRAGFLAVLLELLEGLRFGARIRRDIPPARQGPAGLY